MRVFLIVLSVFSCSILFGQRDGGGGQMGGQRQGSGQGGQQRERPQMREFNASEVAGILNYDSSKALKKIKIKDKVLQLGVKKAIVNYNNKINDIALLNKENFDALNVYVNAKMKSRSNNRGEGRQSNDSAGSNDRELIKQKINPARKEVRETEEKLNKELEALLTEKQFSKWLKYQKQVRDDLKPKQNENQNNNSGMSSGGRGGGQRAGMGGGF